MSDTIRNIQMLVKTYSCRREWEDEQYYKDVGHLFKYAINTNIEDLCLIIHKIYMSGCLNYLLTWLIHPTTLICMYCIQVASLQ